MPPRASRVAAVLLCSTSSALAAAAPVRWFQPEVSLLVDCADLKPEQCSLLVRSLQSAVEVWRRTAESCGAPRLRVLPPQQVAAGVRRDGVNLVTLRRKRWCPRSESPEADCHPSQLAGLTSQFVEQGAAPGALAEADIDINGVRFKWSADGSVPGTLSLTALLAHELGHFYGLTHPGESDASNGRRGANVSTALRLMSPESLHGGSRPIAAPLAADAAVLCRLYGRSLPAPERSFSGPLAWTGLAFAGITLGLLGFRHARRATAGG